MASKESLIHNHEIPEKAKWDPISTKMLLNICGDEISKTRKPGIAFKNKKWEEIRVEFNNRAKRNHTQKQLKNRMDSLRADWILWKQLTGKETHVESNNHTKTIEANSAWWEAKIRENAKFARFRYQGLEFRDELQHIFGEPMTSQNAQTPIVGLSIESSDKHIDSNVPQEAIESSGKNIGSNVPQEVIESDDEELNLDDEFIPITNTQSKKKRKTSQDIGETVTKDTTKVGFATSMRKIERFVEATELNNDGIAGPSYVCGKYSIPNCIEVMKNIQGEGLLNDRQFCFALELLRNGQSRVILMSLKDSHNALVNWILYKYDL